MENERNYGTEIDELRNDIAEIKELLKPAKKEDAIRKIEDNKKISPERRAEMDELRKYAKETDNEAGVLKYGGFFESGNQGFYSYPRICAVKDLMSMPTDKISVVLSSLGNRQRWEILCALLMKPMTVAQIVEEFDMKTSGKAYHHLNNLIAADLLEDLSYNKDAEKGTYAVKGQRVQGIILLMAAVHDLIDTHYSSGEWEV